MLKKLSMAVIVMSVSLFAACGGGDDKTGDKELSDCAEAFVCAADCPDDDCVQGCLNSVSQKVQQQMVQLAVCSEDSQCDSQTDVEGCLRKNCGDELRECGI